MKNVRIEMCAPDMTPTKTLLSRSLAVSTSRHEHQKIECFYDICDGENHQLWEALPRGHVQILLSATTLNQTKAKCKCEQNDCCHFDPQLARYKRERAKLFKKENKRETVEHNHRSIIHNTKKRRITKKDTHTHATRKNRKLFC
jgi:hypothetical protein